MSFTVVYLMLSSNLLFACVLSLSISNSSRTVRDEHHEYAELSADLLLTAKGSTLLSSTIIGRIISSYYVDPKILSNAKVYEVILAATKLAKTMDDIQQHVDQYSGGNASIQIQVLSTMLNKTFDTTCSLLKHEVGDSFNCTLPELLELKLIVDSNKSLISLYNAMTKIGRQSIISQCAFLKEHIACDDTLSTKEKNLIFGMSGCGEQFRICSDHDDDHHH